MKRAGGASIRKSFFRSIFFQDSSYDRDCPHFRCLPTIEVTATPNGHASPVREVLGVEYITLVDPPSSGEDRGQKPCPGCWWRHRGRPSGPGANAVTWLALASARSVYSLPLIARFCPCFPTGKQTAEPIEGERVNKVSLEVQRFAGSRRGRCDRPRNRHCWLGTTSRSAIRPAGRRQAKIRVRSVRRSMEDPGQPECP